MIVFLAKKDLILFSLIEKHKKNYNRYILI